MKKFRNLIICLILCLSFSISNSYAVSIGSIAELAFQALSILTNYQATVAEKAKAESLLILQFPRTSDLSSINAIRISADDLYNIMYQFNMDGLPCEVVDFSLGSLSNVKVIKCIDEPRDPYTGNLLASG